MRLPPAGLVLPLLLLGALQAVPAVWADEDPAPAPAGATGPDEKAGGRHPRGHLDLDVDRLEHDFGVVGQNEELQTTFTVTNVSREAVEDIRTRADCGCNRVELSKKRLAPGESGTLTVAFQTTVLSGRLQKRVRVWTKDRSRGEIVLKLHISIVRGLILDPGAVSFRDVIQGTTPTARFGVKWHQGAGRPFEIEAVELPGHEQDLAASVAPYVPVSKQDPWRGFVVSVRFLRPPPLGMYSAHLLVRTSDPDAPRLVVPLSANVVGKVWMQTRVLHFGVVPQGAGRTATLKFRPTDRHTVLEDVSARCRRGKLEVEVLRDPRHQAEGFWILRARVPKEAAVGRLDDEVIELHTGVAGEELILVHVRGRVRGRQG